MKKFLVACFALATVLAPGAAGAGFVNNYSSWKELSAATKVGYVMGLWDGFEIYHADDLDHKAVADAIGPCSMSLGLTPAMLVEAVDNYYKDPKNWSRAPFSALLQSLIYNGPCRKFVDEERAKLMSKQ
jgi:hypothetical protein